MRIQTILFDLDGTLIDTNQLIKESFKYTFAKYGLSFTEEEISSFNGPPLKDTFNKINPEKADAMIKTYREHNLSHQEEFVKPFPYVLETLSELKTLEMNLAIVTAKMKDSAFLGIELTGLAPYFETIITLDDVTHSKPHPVPVIKALKGLRAEPKSAIMIGDNYHDIVAGQRAGVLTAGVAWSRLGEQYLLTYQPTYMLQDMRDLLMILKE